MNNETQNGYVLVIMLVLLLSVGGGWLSVGPCDRHNSRAMNGLSAHDQRGLADVRQSLLSYAVLYPYLYGPTGAGPAHLPCPDTDGSRRGSSDPQSGTTERRDGPNPPCSSLSGSEGQLPRHIVLPGYRYMFHSESWQRYEYYVAGGLVNNPLNRMVNLERLVTDAHVPVATISLSSPHNDTVAAQVVVTGDALARATNASVAAWVLQRYETIRDQRCLVTTTQSVNTAEPTESPDNEMCDSLAAVKPNCDSDEPFALLLDQPVISGDECLFDSLESNTIDGVPALRHWFVRNRWHRSIRFSRADACEVSNSAASSCVLEYSIESSKAVTVDEPFIEIFWVRPL